MHKEQHIYILYISNDANNYFKLYDGMITLYIKTIPEAQVIVFSGATKRIATSADFAALFPCVHSTQPKEIIYYLCKQRFLKLFLLN